MLLRRVMDHVREQNWFAVGIDFVIVVIGVYIGIQVSNWNDAVRLQSLERSYLVRVADELKANTVEFASEAARALDSSAALRDFIAVASRAEASDAELVAHTRRYLSDGAFFAKFKPIRATFDELKSTGNLETIGDRELRQELVELHAYFAAGLEIREGNETWIEQGEGRVYLEFDALRFDVRTAALFPEQSEEDAARQIRDNKDLLIRHAAMHYWVKTRTLEFIEEAGRRSQAVLDRIENSL